MSKTKAIFEESLISPVSEKANFIQNSKFAYDYSNRGSGLDSRAGIRNNSNGHRQSSGMI